jgi:hypothetical protein
MIEDEVGLALEALSEQERPAIVWVESGLHDHPDRLQKALQSLVDVLDTGSEEMHPVILPSLRPGRGPAQERRVDVAVDPVSEVILALGFCGKGLQGLVSRCSRLVFPRVDDCISLFLNHGCTREEIPRDTRSYYLTGGWFRHNSSLNEAFEEWVTKFGPERASALRKAMFRGYERVSLIDTKAYRVEDFAQQSREYAAQLDLEHNIVPGSVQLLRRLFLREWDEEIVVVPPGEPIGFNHLFSAETCGMRG